jgi:hypothetical protein
MDNILPMNNTLSSMVQENNVQLCLLPKKEYIQNHPLKTDCFLKLVGSIVKGFGHLLYIIFYFALLPSQPLKVKRTLSFVFVKWASKASRVMLVL